MVDKYLSQIADITYQLSKIQFPLIDSPSLNVNGEILIGPNSETSLGPFATATEFYASEAELLHKAAISVSTEDRAKRKFVAALWKDAILLFADPKHDKGPFPLSHGDLHADNVLVDESGTVTGVLDWDFATTLPFDVFAMPHPQLSFHLYWYGEKQNRPVHASFNEALVTRGKSGRSRHLYAVQETFRNA
jgi:hypothetical protein